MRGCFHKMKRSEVLILLASILLSAAGYALLFEVSWKIVVGVFLVHSSINMAWLVRDRG